MTEEQLRETEARASAATPGPWDPCMVEDHCSAVTEGPFGGTIISAAVTPGTVHANARTRADGEFIAHAREDVPALVAEVRRLRAFAARQAHSSCAGAATPCRMRGIHNPDTFAEEMERCEEARRVAEHDSPAANNPPVASKPLTERLIWSVLRGADGHQYECAIDKDGHVHTRPWGGGGAGG